MTIRNILKNFFLSKGVQPPLSRKKVKSAGYKLTPFLLELKKEVEKADDIKHLTSSQQNKLSNFLSACNDLLADE